MVSVLTLVLSLLRAGVLASLVVCPLFAAMATPAWSGQQPAGGRAGEPNATAAPAASRLLVGDKLRIAFYERLADAEAKWTNQNRQTRPELSFYLHQGISGDFTVQADWRVSLPLLGGFVAADRPAADLAADLEAAFEKAIGRRASVNISLAERQPLYVLGPVKQPGTYRFEPGLTPLHLVALAGGLRRPEADQWAGTEAIRESGKAAASMARLRAVLAKWAVVRAELQGGDVAMPEQLARLSGLGEARALVSEALAERAPLVRARAERERSVAAAVDSARRAVDLARERAEPMRANVESRRGRLEGMRRLFDSGDAHRLLLAQTQGDLSDAMDREASVRSAVAQAEHNLTLVELEYARLKSDVTAGIEQEAAALQREITELSSTLAAGSGIVAFLRPAMEAPPADADLRFEIVRQGPSGAEMIAADATTPLRPGDLVRVGQAPARARMAYGSRLDGGVTTGRDAAPETADEKH